MDFEIDTSSSPLTMAIFWQESIFLVKKKHFQNEAGQRFDLITGRGYELHGVRGGGGGRR